MEYKGYIINNYGLDFEDFNLLNACIWYVENDESIRNTAMMYGFCHATLWRKMQTKLLEICPKLYQEVRNHSEENRTGPNKNPFL